MKSNKNYPNKNFYVTEETPDGLLIKFRNASNTQMPVIAYNQIFNLKQLVTNQDVTITGRGPLVAYLAFGYYLTWFGARTIKYHDGVLGYKSCFLKQEKPCPCEHKKWYSFSSSGEFDELKLEPSPDPNGEWEMEALGPLNIPGEMPSPDSPDKRLCISGKGRAYTYASLGVYAALAGKTEIHIRKESLNKVFVFTPQATRTIKLCTDNHNGLVIGIVGDPNSGKSVFAQAFKKCLSYTLPKWCKIWKYDCDLAAHTPEWYLEGIQSNDPAIQDHVTNNRRQGKSQWNAKKEETVVRVLSTLKQNQDIVIADMPGGRHPHKDQDEDFPPQRIPTDGKRPEMMKACDAFIIIYRQDNPAAFDAWRAELSKHGLEKRVIAGIASNNPDAPVRISKVTRDATGIFQAEIAGLARETDPNALIVEMHRQMADFCRFISYHNVISAAKAGVAKAFLTGTKGTRYGAAVRSASSGRIFSSGQYSSYNHSTNIHAEMGALYQATMAGEPDVDVLCIACSTEEAASPCGMCRQVMLEHSLRTHRDFDVILTSSNDWGRMLRVSELLPCAWNTQPKADDDAIHRKLEIQKTMFDDTDCMTGAYCLQPNEQGKTTLDLVWDGKFVPDQVLVKVKYEQQGSLWLKLPHAFTEPSQYLKYLVDSKLNSTVFPGNAIVHKEQGVLFKNPEKLSLRILPQNILERLNDLAFLPSGLDIADNAFITNSRLLGIHSQNSDYDILVCGSSDKIQLLRQRLSCLLLNGTFQFAEQSASWNVIKQAFPDGTQDGGRKIVAEARYCETFVYQDARFSLMYSPEPSFHPYAFKDDATLIERINVRGIIVNADHACYKRSECQILADNGRTYRLLCYHKLGNMLKNGDRIAVSGYLVADSHDMQKTDFGIEFMREPRYTILLSSFFTDKIVWFKC